MKSIFNFIHFKVSPPTHVESTEVSFLQFKFFMEEKLHLFPGPFLQSQIKVRGPQSASPMQTGQSEITSVLNSEICLRTLSSRFWYLDFKYDIRFLMNSQIVGIGSAQSVVDTKTSRRLEFEEGHAVKK